MYKRQAFDGCLAINAARDNGSIQSVFLLYIGADILIEVFCRVGECGEDDHLLIIGVNRILNLVGQQNINNILDKFGKIKDNASSELLRIRRELASTAGSISLITNRVAPFPSQA